MPAVTNTAQRMSTALAEQCQQSTAIRFAVSFVRESGVKTLLEPLLRAADRKIPIEIITGTYMNVTEPSALYLLRHKLGDRLKLRLYDDRRKSFHLKAYFFEQSRDATVFVGSSNISQAALTTGIEWNYGLRRSVDQAAYAEFERVYQVIKNSAVLADDTALRNYAKHWRKPKQLYLLDDPDSDNYTVLPIVEPRGAQIEALYELERTREDGFDKALVIAATGVGKTYLAAFDSLGFSRVLFVAHREEILRQAEASFRAVRPAATTGLFMGTSKDTDQSLIFASVQTLGRAEYLNASYFNPTDFDYMVVDEFHHAAANSYQNLFSYFKPKFLLGLTATPDRMDNKDIYTLCEHNVAYEVSLKGAINRDWLVPFRYYGIFDSTDYEQIEYQNGKYDVAQLEDSLSRLERAQLVFENYTRYRRSRALGFCASVKHAEYMATYFNQQGVKAACVVSTGTSSYSQNRSEAINGLKEKKIEVIFSVDMFNEGVDIPAVDVVIFLRPTESYTIFMQQLGRGLRKVEGKEYLLVLDFIGNYRKAHFKPSFLSGDISYETARGGVSADDIPLPDGCTANIDFRLVDLFKRLEQREPIKVQLVAEYRDLTKRLGRRPTREETNLQGGLPFRLYYQRYDSWLRFLEETGDLTDEEKSWLGTPAEKFLREMERTAMSKSYKVPTIQAFLVGDTIVPRVSLEAIGQSFRDFYATTKHQVDLQDKRHAAWRTWSLGNYMKLAEENPVHFLSQGRNGFFAYDKDRREFSIVPAVAPHLSPLMAQHVVDVLQYKTADYFRRHY